MNTRKGSRSRLADVLADIKKHGDENDVTPPPPKRRSIAAHHNESKTNPTLGSKSNTPSYILKLYDRSIQFSGDESRENIPLYVLIRSWVHGELSSAQQKKEPKVSKPEEPEPPSQLQPGESVLSLPPPKSSTEINGKYNIYPADDENPDLRIPPWVKNFKKSDDAEQTIDNSIDTMNQADCMELNKKRWKKVKDDWTLARRYHEARYEESFKTLHEMYSSCEK